MTQSARHSVQPLAGPALHHIGTDDESRTVSGGKDPGQPRVVKLGHDKNAGEHHRPGPGKAGGVHLVRAEGEGAAALADYKAPLAVGPHQPNAQRRVHDAAADNVGGIHPVLLAIADEKIPQHVPAQQGDQLDPFAEPR